MINWLKRLFRRDSSQDDLGLEGGFAGPDLDAWRDFHEEGGGHPLQGDLEKYRWIAQTEGVAIGQAEHDPDRWPGGQLAFEFERGLAHDHEVLRDRQAVMTNQWLNEAAADVQELAGELSATRNQLATVDRRFTEVQRDWEDSAADLRQDPLERGRFYRGLDTVPRRIKWVLVVIFVVSEFVMTGQVFEAAVSQTSNIDNLGFLLALGVMVILVAVPHFGARGLKQSVTKVHGYHQQSLEEAGEPVPAELRRFRDNEVQDNLGFRIVAVCVGVGLIALIIPLSILRAIHIGGGSVLWFAVFVLLQLCLSGYFFLREWHDHTGTSSDHRSVTKQLEATVIERDEILANLSEANDEMSIAAEEYLALMRAYPRHDDQIVSSYWATLHFHRHVVVQVNPGLAPYVNLAPAPQPAGTEAPSNVTYPLDPLFNEHPSIEDNAHTGGRLWVRNEIENTLSRTGNHQCIDWIEPGSFQWRTPEEILHDSLAVRGLSCRYQPPAFAGTGTAPASDDGTAPPSTGTS